MFMNNKIKMSVNIHRTLLCLFGVVMFSLITESACPFGTFGTMCQFRCHCKEPLDCDKNTGNCESGCTGQWSGRNCQQENVSFNASTSHKVGTGSTESWYGVDGNTSTCAITSAGVNGWWMVKFDKPHTIHKIYLNSGTNTSLFDWQIIVGDDSNLFTMVRCSEIKSHESSASVFCDRPKRGQYLAVLNRHGPVVICDLSVYICSKYSFGPGCERHCSCKEPNEQCDIQTGGCSSGCQTGRQGVDCQIECLGSYGPGCSYKCGHCLNGTTCESMSGLCPLHKCDPGWEGRTCHRECSVGFYGYKCNSRCGHCSDNLICHHVNGSCPSGCQSGWRGKTCMEECNTTHFGKDCLQPCGNCFDGSCNKQTGECTSGCKPGLQGDRCDTECTPGRWGLRCGELCGHCQKKVCDLVNGTCDSACEPGWTGNKCLEECPGGMFGMNCIKVCGKCKGAVCNTTDGRCLHGCLDGFGGEHCTPQTSASPIAHAFEEETTNTLQVFLGVSVTIVISVMVCLIFCLVSNWRREDISKYDRQLEVSDKDIRLEETRHLNCNGELSS
ncbi:multiple epidermal growth factor-like domains protein 10 isoform X4 [Mytilus californianus]|uniref:multiple epidermal growth factor-like domains protein 10 isoform X4 n=1 Tax=Mytilus californianus TaxID=6549 RepID=UPI00224619A3|nr:multiple epidermal growth factor-like domains protein 10 isoform X4 [Mytilus californianus]